MQAGHRPIHTTSRTQRHYIPSADQSKHAIRSGTARTIAHRRKSTGRADPPSMATRKERHMRCHRHRHRRRLIPPSAKTGGAAENATNRKEDKYVDLQQTYTFVPLAFETLGPINVKGVEFLQQLGHRLVAISDDNRQTSFLFQRISIMLQRFNAITFADTFA